MTAGRPPLPERLARTLVVDAARRAGLSPERTADLLAVEVGRTDREAVYRENKLTLYHYEPRERTHRRPVLAVYALINRPYILDLQPDRSVIRRLLEAGFAVYLVDWGRPSALDRSLTMTDYVDRYLADCVEAVREHAGVDAPHLLGYCMGGTLSVLYAARHPDRVHTLSLLATPVAFDGTGGLLEHWATHIDPGAAVDAFGNVPGGLLAVAFSLLEPVEQSVGKYCTLYANVEDESFVRTFLRMERWIWDAVDVAGETYREFVTDLYRENRLAEGRYRLGGRRIDLGEIDCPVQQLVGEHDHIVPPAASRPLNNLIGSDDERIVEFPAGHVGLSVSGRAHADLWPEVCSWLADRDGQRPDRVPTGRPPE